MNDGRPAMRTFARSLPMALMRAREAIMREFRPVLAAHDLTEQQWRLLRALADAPAPVEVGELAATTFLLGPSVSRMLSALEARRLVARVRVAHDGRRSAVWLTAAGRRLLAQVGPEAEARYAVIEARFGRDRLAQLEALLAALAEVDAAAEADAPELEPASRS